MTRFKIVAVLLWMLTPAVLAFAADVDGGIAAVKSGRYAEALKILLPMANAGNDEAQRVVGEMCYNGQGMKPNPLAAFKWNELAAAAGNRVAQYNLGYLYERGEGVGSSRDQAIAWYTKSAVQDYTAAQHRLGDLYASLDRNKAVYWYGRARENGDAVAFAKFSALSSQREADLDAEKKRQDAEDREKARREYEQQRAENEERQRKAASESQSVAGYNAAIMGQIQRRGAEDAALLRRIDRQTRVAVAESNRVRAEQAADRDHARAKREEAEHRRTAERDRAARAGTPEQAATPQPDLPRYQTQVVVIPTGPKTCPPGSSPARHANGQTIAIPATAYCIRDLQGAAGQNTAQAPDGADGRDPASARRADAGAARPVKSENGSSVSGKTVQWGPLQKEAMAICHQYKNGHWRCDGPVQMELTAGSSALENALSGQQCAGGTRVAGGPVIDGAQWEAFRCNHAIGAGDRDIAPRYGLGALQRSFMCPKGLGDGRCTQFYDGQDRR